jgi:hypothetical protein
LKLDIGSANAETFRNLSNIRYVDCEAAGLLAENLYRRVGWFLLIGNLDKAVFG